MKIQMRKPDHPVQILNKNFAKYFVHHYKGYVNKKTGSVTAQDLTTKIERETIKLRKIYHDDTLDVNFSDKVLGDTKKFIAILLFTALRFYLASLQHNDILKVLL